MVSDDDRRQFEDLFRDHVQAIFRYALARSDDHDTARDVVAETFLVAWRRLPDVPADPRAGCSASLDGFSRPRSAPPIAAGLFTLPEGSASARVRRWFGSRSKQANCRASLPSAAFAQLSARDQETLSLVAWDGLSNVEAARSWG